MKKVSRSLIRPWTQLSLLRVRFGVLAIGLLILPWSLVGLSTVRYWHSLQAPTADSFDLNEILNLAAAVEAYAIEHGEYPPDFSSGNPRSEIDQHLARIFPNRDAKADRPLFIGQLGPHNALHFWLRGFTDDSQLPLTGVSRRNPRYAFVPARLSLKNEYSPRSCRAPYVYFRSKTYGSAHFQGRQAWGMATPYLAQRQHQVKSYSGQAFVEPNGFQIIAAGKDGVFETGQIAFIDAATTSGHADNIASFYRDGPLALEQLAKRQSQCRRSARNSVAVAFVCLVLYSLLLHLRNRVNGLDDLRQLVARQARSEMLSDAWHARIIKQRQSRRQRTIDRMARRHLGLHRVSGSVGRASRTGSTKMVGNR